MGLWSDESYFRVLQVEFWGRWFGRIVWSGEVGWCRCWWVGGGSLVDLLSFMIMWVELFIILFIVMPRWSFVGECHVWWCAFRLGIFHTHHNSNPIKYFVLYLEILKSINLFSFNYCNSTKILKFYIKIFHIYNQLKI